MSKPTGRSKQLAVIDVSKVSFRYYLDVEYDTEHNCSRERCADDMCRCGKIRNAKLEDFSITNAAMSIINNCHIKNPEDHYFIERILNFHNLTEEDFHIDIRNGYYGEEVENVLLECGKPRTDSINEQINHLLKLETLKEKLFYALEIEYQNVLPELEGLYYSIEEIDKSL